MTLLGTHEELDEAGLSHRHVLAREISDMGTRARMKTRRVARTVLSIVDRPLRVAGALGLVLLAISTLVLHFGYHWSGHGSHHLPVLDSIYFTVETVATVGFGDFSFSNEPTSVEVFGICLIVAGTTLVTTLFALLTNALVSRRIAQSLGRERIPGMRGHVVIVGLGTVGMHVLEGLIAQGREVGGDRAHGEQQLLGAGAGAGGAAGAGRRHDVPDAGIGEPHERCRGGDPHLR